MDPERPGPRPGALSDLEARLLAAAVGKRLFQKPAEPVQLGRYRVLERIGQGGMSVVFRAHDPQLRREVAVKLLHSPRGAPDPEHQARLRREAHALGRLSHPNVVQVFEIGEAEGQTFVVMELVRGTTLREWLRASPRALAEVVTTVVQAGRGLAAAHAAGLVHRDFKPENVLIGADGRARVVDFGLARASPAAPTSVEASTGSLGAPLTRTGTILGTPAFMAPEQLREAGRADARSDQFSFCVMAYEALYGERPFDDLTTTTVRPAPADSRVPPPLREALLRGLQHDPALRWPTMDALLAALEGAAGGDIGGARPQTGRRSGWLAGAGALALLVALAAWLAWPRPEAARPVATREGQLAALLAAGDVAGAERLLAELPDAAAASLAETAPAWGREGGAFAQARDLALAEQATRLLRSGQIEAAARANARRTPDEARRAAASALGARLSALLDSYTRLSLRFTGPAADRWVELDPPALRGDPVDGALTVTTGGAGPLVAWGLELVGDRLLVDVTLEPAVLAPGGTFAVRVQGADASAELGLRTASDGGAELALEWTCGPAATPGGPIDRPAPVSLQLDVDAAAGTASCRLLDAAGTPTRSVQVPLAGRFEPGEVRLELRGDEGLRVRVTRVEVLGTRPTRSRPYRSIDQLVGAMLADGDALAALRAFENPSLPWEDLLVGVALLRLGRPLDARSVLLKLLNDERDPEIVTQLQRWLRADPSGLAPPLRLALHEPNYFELFLATYRRALAGPRLAPELVRVLLTELAGVDDHACLFTTACAELRRAYGRALAQVGEPARARRAFEAALAATKDDAAGRALASQLVLDLALVRSPQ